MKYEDACRTVADYLLARSQPTEPELQRACDAIERDEAGAGRMKDALGLVDDLISPCEGLLDNVAELAELSPDAQRTEMPALVRHLGECSSCLAAYLEVAATRFTGHLPADENRGVPGPRPGDVAELLRSANPALDPARPAPGRTPVQEAGEDEGELGPLEHLEWLLGNRTPLERTRDPWEGGS